MSSFLCFICHSTVNSEISEVIREKYRDVVGINLCPDSQLCYICCHVLNKLSLFKSICLKRSLEYPVLFSEKGTLNLHKSDLEVHVLCPDDCIEYQQQQNCRTYECTYNNVHDDTNYSIDNQYVELEDELQDFDLCVYQTGNKEKLNDSNITKLNEAEIVIDENSNDKNEITDTTDTDINRDNENNEDEVCSNQNSDNTQNISEDVNEKKIKKSNKTKKVFKKIILSLEEQKAELEANRREKYVEAEFKCYNCALGFLFKDTYQAHMMRHEESNGEFQCSTCTLRFATVTLLRAHTTSHMERYNCTKCGASLKPRKKRLHECVRTDAQSVACQFCGNLFRDANGLQQHLRRIHTSKTGGRLLSCVVCGESYKNQAALRTHMIKHIKRKFHCDQCPATYSSPYTLTQHKRSHESLGQLHHCSTCGIGYATRKSLLAHKRNTMNHQQTLFECPICNRICSNQKSLASHIQTVHSSTKDYRCTECPARYTSRKSLVRHIGTHSKKPEVKMAICHLCGGTFKGNNKLNRHLKAVCEKAKLEEEISTLFN